MSEKQIERRKKELQEIIAKQEERFKALGFLHEFIDGRVRSYIEPRRTRRYRGEKVAGFPKDKYTASLLTLLNLPHREIAQLIKFFTGKVVSVTQVRVWKTQKDFKEKVLGHAFIFANKFIERIHTRAEEGLRDFENRLINASFEDLKKTNPFPIASYEEFNDGRHYSPGLRLLILKLAALSKIEIGKENALALIGEYFACFLFMGWFEPFKPGIGQRGVKGGLDEFRALKEEFMENLQLSTLSHIVNLLFQNSIKESERKAAAFCLRQLEEWLKAKLQSEKKPRRGRPSRGNLD